jgi:hypothetical protein
MLSAVSAADLRGLYAIIGYAICWREFPESVLGAAR